MKPVSALVPTRRELVLLAGLLVFLLFITRSEYIPTSNSVSHVLDGANENASHGVQNSVAVSNTYPEPRLTWTDAVPETKMLHHVPGWTVFDRLYLFEGTIFIVTSTPEAIPERKLITSSGYDIFNEPEEIRKRLPSDKDIRVVTPAEAQRIFNTHSASHIDGASFLVTDPKQFITHYYHFSAELLFGLWRAYTALDPFITPDGRTALPPPRRFIFRHVGAEDWRDYAAMNQWVVRGAFPGIGLEFSEDWTDRGAMHVPFVLDRVVLADRSASYEGDPFKGSWRSASNAFDLRGSPHWWVPLRKSVLEFSGLAREWITGPTTSAQAENEKYVITYVSRQEWGRRMLKEKDHEKLVEELYKLRDKYGYEVNIIMMGIHGNGLTSLLWMRPTRRSTVIEFFFPKGFAYDYEFTTRALGMTHYGVWNDKLFTQPNVPHQQAYPEGFQGNEIPLDGAVVARLVHQRLTLGLEESES
ncbi:hypothetical protein EW145_g4737 [Phellinidium pouzarii]|uniref:Uncharacterized protein n=1 Tax=Phellinidium pouzarii TaxID=167371 RepID=A0A4S4L2F9_9AGAM|nr:hypothetical protein EW145_g4737 [Phellinidium pouzarii]